MKFFALLAAVFANPVLLSSRDVVGTPVNVTSCSASPSLKVSEFDVNPYPIKAGKEVTVYLKGDLGNTVVTAGSFLHLTINWSGFSVTLFRDLCELAASYGSTCKLHGPLTILDTFTVPTFITADNYNITLTVLTADNQEIYCGQVLLQVD
ncbi:hypothetical protein HDV06_003412 [Boothiomyces sp. JEL0866]|nr:hypothetical protein HDV06_003364 [Boothiomyces sp. JEL0866]KAJ3325642.1 hypothetical protein HDV06_003412 [Boothiomyces sp. JEL0866]